MCLAKEAAQSAIESEDHARALLEPLRQQGKHGNEMADALWDFRKQILAREAAKKLGNAYAQGGQLHFDYKDLGLKKR